MNEWKRVLGSRIGRTAGLVGCLMLTMGVSDNNGCAPDPGSGGECVADSDCTGDPGIDCVGAWSCDSGECEFECGEPEPEGCYGDQDCADGLVCNAADVCLPPPGCEPGAPCPAVCYGACVEPEPEAGCYSDNDCRDAGQHCSVSDGDCQRPPGCEDGQACPAVCYGSCVDDTETCDSNDDCDEGEICGCGPFEGSADALVPCFLQCIPDPNLECRADSDCREGYSCTDGRCVENTHEGCYDNSQCGDGQVCNTWDYCDVPGTDPSFLIACLGRCEDAPSGCGDGETCPAGTHCIERCTDNCVCPDFGDADPADDEARPACECDLNCESECVPDEPNHCDSDSDCGEGSYCGCGDGGWGASDALVCIPQCIPRDYDCRTDSDCGDRGRCNIQVCDGGGAAPPFEDPDCDSAENPDCRRPEPTENCYGYCEYVEPPEYDCTSNDQCASGICDFVVCEAQAPPACDPDDNGECRPADPLPAQCYGFCRDEPMQCGADGTCPEGYHCGCDNPFTPGPDGSGAGDPSFVPCFPVCIADDDPNGECESDRDCRDDQYCAITHGGGYCLPRPPAVCYSDDMCGADEFCDFESGCHFDANGLIACGGICAPRPNDDCYSDGECGAGQVCVRDDCWAEPVDGAADERVACPGHCEPAPQEFCFGDNDCREGEYCSYENGCGVDPANGLIACAGVCEPRPDPVCFSDRDCAEGEYCEIDSCDSNCGACPPDEPCAPCDVACTGTCQEQTYPQECASDRDCDDGEVCGCGPNPACPNCLVCFQQCIPAEPEPFDCSTTDRCGLGQECRIEVCAPCACEIDPDNPDGGCINECPCFGYCEDVRPPAPPCDDNQQCGEGMTCQCLPDPSCPMCDVCYFGCVADEPDTCLSDRDCADNEYCEQGVCPMFLPCSDEDCPGCEGTCKERETEPDACVVTGCSGQVCADEPVFTTCEWSPHYECYRLAECGQGADGTCGWSSTEAFRECMERNGGFSSAE